MKLYLNSESFSHDSKKKKTHIISNLMGEKRRERKNNKRQKEGVEKAH